MVILNKLYIKCPRYHLCHLNFKIHVLEKVGCQIESCACTHVELLTNLAIWGKPVWNVVALCSVLCTRYATSNCNEIRWNVTCHSDIAARPCSFHPLLNYHPYEVPDQILVPSVVFGNMSIIFFFCYLHLQSYRNLIKLHKIEHNFQWWPIQICTPDLSPMSFLCDTKVQQSVSIKTFFQFYSFYKIDGDCIRIARRCNCISALCLLSLSIIFCLFM